VFRYVAWVGEVEGDFFAAASALCTLAAGWRMVYRARRLTVWCRGTRPGSTEVYELEAECGVVLGKLFAHDGSGPLYRPAPIRFEANESRALLEDNGRRLLTDYHGRYVAFLQDPSAQGIVRIVRGPGGGPPCLRVRLSGGFLYGSSMEDLATLLPERPTINWDYVCAWLCSRVSGQATGLREISQLVGGECETVIGDRQSSTIVWNPLHLEHGRVIETVPEAVEILRETVRSVIHAWASCYERIMISLSGGLDSSIVTVCLRDAPSRLQVRCFTHYIRGPDSDERSYAQAVADRAGFPLISLERDANADLRSMLNLRPSATLWNLVHQADVGRSEAELASRTEAQAVFTGEGGDQSFYGARASLAAGSYLRRRGLRPHLLTVAWDAARVDRTSLWAVLGRAARDVVPGGAWTPQREVGKFNTLLTPAAVACARRGGLAVHPWLRDLRASSSGARWHTAMLSIERPLYDALRKEDEGPDLIHPLMMQPVVEVCRRIPPDVHIYSGWDRAIARLAFERDLPECVSARRAKGGLEEHARRMLLQNSGFVGELLWNGALMRRGLVDAEKVAEFLSQRPSLLGGTNLDWYDLLSAEAWVRSWVAV